LAQDSFLDLIVTPTSLSIGGTFNGYATLIMKLLTFYRWSHVTVLLQAKTATTFYSVLANTLISRAKTRQENKHLFAIDLFTFENAEQSMAAGLDYAKKRSRGI
jgi:hypothetical protein